MADSELNKVRMQLRRQRAQQLYSTRSRANSLGHFAVYYNDPSLINKVWREYEQSPKPISSEWRKSIFPQSNRTVVTTLPKTAAGPERQSIVEVHDHE